MPNEAIESFELLGAGSHPIIKFKFKNRPKAVDLPIAELHSYQHKPQPDLFRELYAKYIKQLKAGNDIVQNPGHGSSELAVDVYVNAAVTMQGRKILRLDQMAEVQNPDSNNVPNIAIAPGFKPFTMQVNGQTVNGMQPFKEFLKQLKNKPNDFYPKRIVFPCAVGSNHITPLVIEIDANKNIKVRHFDSMGNPGAQGYEQTKKNIEQAIKDEFGADKVDYKRISAGGDVNNMCCSDWSAWFIREIATNPNVTMDKLESEVRSKLAHNNPKTFIHDIHREHFELTNKLLTKLEAPKKGVSFDINPQQTSPAVPLNNEQITKIDQKFETIGFKKTDIQNNELRVYAKEDKKVTVSSAGLHGSPGVYTLEEFKAMINAARDAMPGKVLVLSNSDPEQHKLLVQAAQAIKQEDKNFEFTEKKPVEKKPQTPEVKKQVIDSTSQQNSDTEPERLQIGKRK